MTHPHSEDSVERLIKLAGERDLPSAAGTQRARAASERAWREMLARPAQTGPRRARCIGLGMALAASALAALWLVRIPEPEQPLTVARAVVLDGGVTARGADGERPVRVNQALPAGTTLMTRHGRLAVQFAGALSLRMDHETRLRLDAPDHVTLIAGSLYVDSGGLNVSSPLRISTPAGDVSHIGTQFQVSVSGPVTRVRVREGRVLVMARASGASQDLATGDALEARGAAVQVTHGLPGFGAEWAWVASVAPVFEIENRPLAEFLAWLVREQGWQLRYASDDLQRQAASIRLHGTLDGLDTDAMLERVALITDVPLRLRDGVLSVGTR